MVGWKSRTVNGKQRDSVNCPPRYLRELPHLEPDSYGAEQTVNGNGQKNSLYKTPRRISARGE